MNAHEKVFINFLKEKGLKLTKPRRIILEAVFLNHDHFDIETLYDQIRNEYKDVSRATIYRTVPLLVEAGLIKKPLRQDCKDHYEHTYGHRNHLHLVCSKCNKIIEESSKQVEGILLDLADKNNFRIDEFNLIVAGLCKRCRKKIENNDRII